MVYLIHFQTDDGQHYKVANHAGHYLGYTGCTMNKRLARHIAGDGSPLVRAALDGGANPVVVRTWPGGRHLERQLKNRKNSPKLCPTCNP